MIPVVIAGAAVVFLAGKYIYDRYSGKDERDEEEKRRQNQERQDREAAEFEERLSKARDYIAGFESEWRATLAGFMLVDSNIWMNYEYNVLFRNLAQLLISTSIALEMPTEQFDEIVNLKNLPYDNPKSKLARCALSRIEEFQNKKVLKIVPMGIDAVRGAYADPEILKILMKASKTHPSVTLVSDDRELRIRANQLVSEASSNPFKAVEGKRLLDAFAKYESSLNLVRSSS